MLYPGAMKNPRKAARKLVLSVSTIRELTPGQLADAGGGVTGLTIVTRTCPTLDPRACDAILTRV